MTIEAIGSQRELADRIGECGGDYVLAVKPNQPTRYERAEEAISAALEEDAEDPDDPQTVAKGHGSQESRS